MRSDSLILWVLAGLCLAPAFHGTVDRTRGIRRGFALLVVLGLLAPACSGDASQEATQTDTSARDAEPGTRPPLSEVIREALEEDGPEAARRRFEEIYPRRQAEYEVDLQTLMQMAAEYAQEGDMAAAEVLFEIGSTVAAADVDAALAGMPAPPGDGRKTSPEEADPAPSHEYDPGPPRRDLDRFLGVYGDPARQEPIPRNVFVSVTCDGGHLEFGAMWGDVAPWVMRSEADHVFVQALRQPGETGPPIRLEFRLGPDGRARALTHGLAETDEPQERLSDLPEYFADRECPPRR